MKKLFFIILLLPSIGLTANDGSGYKLLEQCSYADALIHGKKINVDLGEDYAFLCLGYVSGVYDALFMGNQVCGPNVADWNQARIVYNYLNENSEILHFDRHVLTKIALKKGYSCNSSATEFLSSTD